MLTFEGKLPLAVRAYNTLLITQPITPSAVVFLGRGVVLSSHSLVLFEFLTLEQTTLSNLHTHKRYGVDHTIVEYGVEVLEDEGSTAAAAVAAATISSNGDGTLVRHLMLEAVAMWTFARSSSYREPSKTCSTPHN